LAQVAEPNAVLGTILQQTVDLAGAKRGVFVEVRPEGTLEFRVEKANRDEAVAPGTCRSHSHRFLPPLVRAR
jgi:hypothetical protein